MAQIVPVQTRWQQRDICWVPVDSAHLIKTHGCRFVRFGPLHANSGNVRTDDSAHTVRRASHTRCVYVYFVVDLAIVLFVIVHLFMQ